VIWTYLDTVRLISVTEDLDGLKVNHDLDALAEGEEEILTLKDSRILDNEGENLGIFLALNANTSVEDELQNVLLAEHKRTEERIQLKTKNKGYTGYDDDEFKDGQAGMKRKVLAKYDEDINGPQETVSSGFTDTQSMTYHAQGFRIGSTATSTKASAQAKETAPKTVNTALLTIDYSSESWRVVPSVHIPKSAFCRKS